MNKFLLGLAISSVALAGGLSTANAANADGTLKVSATIKASCTVSAEALDFGDVTPGQEKTASATITVDCSGVGDATAVTVGDGNYFVSPDRRMSNGADYIPYKLCNSSGCPSGSDIGHNGTLKVTDAKTAKIYGLAKPAAELKGQGSFGDSVHLTIVY